MGLRRQLGGRGRAGWSGAGRAARPADRSAALQVGSRHRPDRERTCVCATRFWCSTNTLNQASRSSDGRILGVTARGDMGWAARLRRHGREPGCMRTARGGVAQGAALVKVQPRPRLHPHHSTWPGVWNRRHSRSSRRLPSPYSATRVPPFCSSTGAMRSLPVPLPSMAACERVAGRAWVGSAAAGSRAHREA